MMKLKMIQLFYMHIWASSYISSKHRAPLLSHKDKNTSQKLIQLS